MSDKQRQRVPAHAPGSIRHAEKRRTGTCRFADRVAQVSLDAYRSCVPQSFRDHQKTCIATIVAHFPSDNQLQVVGLGTGTKFLTEAVLQGCDEEALGSLFRVRDCHGEVLARRAFRRELALEMKILKNGASIESTCTSYRPILCQAADGESFKLVDGVTLHFYCSSAPCGNAVLKKFAKMEKETFQSELGPDEWPSASHEPIPAHSIRLGQFALLVKRDSTATENSTYEMCNAVTGKSWPAEESDDWCPPGTSSVFFEKGSLHTCSDKICRWNCLGFQGSLLASMLEHPLYMSTITVGRKFNECICRRAVCCRANGFGEPLQKGRRNRPNDSECAQVVSVAANKYSLHHPAIMGTGVYMDDSGIIDMTDAHTRKQDAHFDSTLSWAWWPLIRNDKGILSCKEDRMVECIDGSTGLMHDCVDKNNGHFEGCGRNAVSMVSTFELTSLFLQAKDHHGADQELHRIKTLDQLRDLKRLVSPKYEAAKEELLSKHKVFRYWRRRQVRSINGLQTIRNVTHYIY